LLATTLLLCACSAIGSAPTALPGEDPASDAGDPTQGEVPLPSADGWNAFLVHAADVGVWTVAVLPVFGLYGSPEIVGLDDLGRCTVLISYSGKWTPLQTVQEGEWFGPVVHADVDPAYAGRELYVGGKRGNVYQIRPHATGGFDARIVAHIAGEEVHTLAAADLSFDDPGDELLAFTHTGAVYALRPGDPREEFAREHVAQLPGRARDALVIPAPHGGAPSLAVANRAGEVALLKLGADGLKRRVILSESMGFGRIARRRMPADDRPVVGDLSPPDAIPPEVLYVTRDDGLVLRLEETTPGGSWQREVVYAGPQGPRGLVSGRFDTDPGRETLAVFGYDKKVQILSRADDGSWNVETVFTDIDKGHWLAVGELDGRNGTDEIVSSGYSGRIVMLARPPGYGLVGVATDPDD
jgi:hypothetical protein